MPHDGMDDPAAGRRRGTAPGRRPDAVGPGRFDSCPAGHGDPEHVWPCRSWPEPRDGSRPSGSTEPSPAPTRWPCHRSGPGRFTSGRGGIRKTHRPQTPADRKVHESSILSARTLAGARPRAGDTPSICWSRFPPSGSIPVLVASPSRGDAGSMKSRAPAVPRPAGAGHRLGPFPVDRGSSLPGHVDHSAVVQGQHTWL
jgi:hypothetical protein